MQFKERRHLHIHVTTSMSLWYRKQQLNTFIDKVFMSNLIFCFRILGVPWIQPTSKDRKSKILHSSVKGINHQTKSPSMVCSKLKLSHIQMTSHIRDKHISQMWLLPWLHSYHVITYLKFYHVKSKTRFIENNVLSLCIQQKFSG